MVQIGKRIQSLLEIQPYKSYYIDDVLCTCLVVENNRFVLQSQFGTEYANKAQMLVYLKYGIYEYLE